MDRNGWMAGTLLALAGVIAGLTFLLTRNGAGRLPGSAPAVAVPTARRTVAAPPAAHPAPARGDVLTTPPSEAARAHAPRRAADEPPPAPGAASAAPTGREQANAAWEALLDQVIEQKDTPASAQAPRLKAAFDTLDREDQMDAVQRALNLLPGEQFPALYAILFDKTEAPAVLDAIFSDALNRPEALKHPLLKELSQDREHPLYPEAVRILEIVPQ